MKRSLDKAKKNKSDEFYTQLIDIEKELSKGYKEFLKGKKVFCNTDNYEKSNFVKYLKTNFKDFELKSVESLDIDGNYMFYDGNAEKTQKFDSGEFEGEETKRILEQVDVVITNPPFSLFRDFIRIMMDYNKDFIVIGSQNAVTYKDISPLIKEEKVFIGHTYGTMKFRVPKDPAYERKTAYWVDEDGQPWRSLGNIIWLTTFPVSREKDFLTTKATYSADKYSEFDNYPAINIDRVNQIPLDYKGIMGVPVTFLNRWNPAQFKIIGFRKGQDGKDLRGQGRDKYFRVLIKKIKEL